MLSITKSYNACVYGIILQVSDTREIPDLFIETFTNSQNFLRMNYKVLNTREYISHIYHFYVASVIWHFLLEKGVHQQHKNTY